MNDATKAVPIVDLDAGQNWGAQTVELEHPFKLAGVTYERVELRTPMGLDIERYLVEPKSTTAAFMKSLAGVPVDVFDRMHPSDYRKCFAAAAHFLA